jgi:hypothetical protein
LTADIDSIQSHVFTPICSVCHAGGGAPQGLRLDAANAYNLLVGVPSTEVPSILRVKPGDPGNSYIVQKLEGHAAVGAQMPFGGPPLTADVIAVIRQWITDGAQRSVTVAAAATLQVTAVAPASGDVLEAPPPQIMVAFNQDIDAARLDPQALRLENVTGEDPVTAALSVPVVTVSPAVNRRAILLSPRTPLALGHYRVVLATNRGDAVLSEFEVGGEP